MLQLRKGRPIPIRISLGGGAFAMVRPATTFEADLAVAEAGNLLAGLIDSQESSAAAAAMLGEEYGAADFTTPAWINAAANRVALLQLATLCVESWGGIVDETGAAIESPTREMLALLLRDSATAKCIGDIINSQVNVEIAEKKEFSPLPAGAAAGDENTARIVAAPAPTAQ